MPRTALSLDDVLQIRSIRLRDTRFSVKLNQRFDSIYLYRFLSLLQIRFLSERGRIL